MAKGDVTIRFTNNDNAPNPEIRALMPDYQASTLERLEAQNQGNRFMRESQAVGKTAEQMGAASVNVEGNLGSALTSAYDQKMHRVEITHTTNAGTLGFGSKQEVLYQGSITPQLANELEQAVARIGDNLKNLAVQCEKGNLSSTQCEEFKQTLPSAIISEALEKSGNSR